MKNRSLTMTQPETIAGLCYLPFYLVLWSLILPVVFTKLGISGTLISVNLCYFYINFIAVVVIFHRTLASSFRAIGHEFWPFLQALILGFALYYAGNLLVNVLLGWLAPDLVNPNDETVNTMAADSFRATLVCAVFLGPLVEEVLVRGLVFGNLHKYNRIAAYIVSSLLFCAMHLWQYAFTTSPLTLLLCVLQYIPACIALAWTYEKSSNLWCPIVLHVLLNAMSLGILQMFG
jgi:hypothetical protein